MQPQPPIEPRGVFDGLRASAVLLGALVDVALTLVGAWLLIAWIAPEALGAGEAELAALLERLHASPLYVGGSIATGSLATFGGAFVGARSAGRLFVSHGGWIAVTSAAIGALLMAAQNEPPPEPAVPFPLWAEVLGWVLILPSGIAGGALAGALAARRGPE